MRTAPTTTTAARVGARVKGLMAEKGFTQEQVADHLGLKQPAIARRLSGQIAFDVNELKAVADLLSEPLSAITEAA